MNGVCVVVPRHIAAQSVSETVGLLNLSAFHVPEIDNQFHYRKGLSISDLPAPFDRPDLVVIHETYNIENIILSRQLRKNHIPYILLPHGDQGKKAQQKKWLKKKAANILLFHHFVNRAVAVQCLSQGELDTTRVRTQKFIGTNGIDLPDQKKDQFSNDGLKILYIGRLDAYHKGLDLMIEGIASVKEFLKEHNVSVQIFGPDYQGRYAHVEDLISQNDVGNIVTLHHEIVGELKKQELLACDIFLQTSRSEGMPMGILEALSYGIPCIVTRGTNVKEIIDEYDAGWTAETTAKSIGEALRTAISERQKLPEKSLHGKKLIQENFLWDTIARKTIQQYKGWIENKKV